MKILFTGSSGLIGSEAVEYFDRRGHVVFGIGNNIAPGVLWPAGDTTRRLCHLQKMNRRFTHLDLDSRSREQRFDLFKANRFDWVVDCAAQPSHDRAAYIPLIDFDVNLSAPSFFPSKEPRGFL